jgi:hypothetical protein
LLKLLSLYGLRYCEIWIDKEEEELVLVDVVLLLVDVELKDILRFPLLLMRMVREDIAFHLSFLSSLI